MNRLQALEQQLKEASTIPSKKYIDIDLPFNLKDICKIKFKGQIRWNADTESWSVCEEVLSQFDKVFLENHVSPTKEQRLILKQQGCNFDVQMKLWYMLRFQTLEIEEDV
jgi:hypothetical protein